MSCNSLRIVEATDNKYRERTINGFYFIQNQQAFYLKTCIDNDTLCAKFVFNQNPNEKIKDAEKISFKDILGLGIYKLVMRKKNDNYYELYVLSLFTQDKRELIIAEDRDLIRLRTLGEKISKFTQSSLKLSFGGNAGQFFLKNDFTRNYTELDIPYIIRLKDRVEDGKAFVDTESEFEDIDYKLRFIDNSNTAFISYKVPYLYSGKITSLFYILLCLIVGSILILTLMKLGVIPESQGPQATFITLLSITPLLACFVGFFFLLRDYIFYQAEFVIDNCFLKYSDKSIFGKSGFEFKISELEEILVEKRFRDQITVNNNNMLQFTDHSKFYFISDNKICELYIPEELALKLKNSLNKAFLQVREHYCDSLKSE